MLRENWLIGFGLTGTLRSSPWRPPLPPVYSAPVLPTCSPFAPGSPGQIIYWSCPSGKRLALSVDTHTHRQHRFISSVVQICVHHMSAGVFIKLDIHLIWRGLYVLLAPVYSCRMCGGKWGINKCVYSCVTPVTSSSFCCFLLARSWAAISSSYWISSCFLQTDLNTQTTVG